MISRSQVRLECLKLANVMGSSKNIKPEAVIPTAMEYFRWVDDDPEDKSDTQQLTERFRVARS